MKYTLKIIFGKEQVSKIYNNEPLTDDELNKISKMARIDSFYKKLEPQAVKPLGSYAFIHSL